MANAVGWEDSSDGAAIRRVNPLFYLFCLTTDNGAMRQWSNETMRIVRLFDGQRVINHQAI